MNDVLFAFVINAAWQTTIVGALALGIDWLLREADARWRFGFIVSAIVIGALLPFSLLLPVRAVAGAVVVGNAAPGWIGNAELALIAIAAVNVGRRWIKASALVKRSTFVMRVENVEVRSADVATPLAAGIVRPVILLPHSLLDDDVLGDAAIRHELAHIARHDTLLEAIVAVITIPVSFHPAIVLLRRRMAILRELCCDDLASASTGTREYVRALVAIAHIAARGEDAALAMARTAIEVRVARLRASRATKRPYARMTFAFAAMIVARLAGCRWSSRAHVGGDLSGTWALDRAASDPRTANEFTAYEQRIAQHGAKLDVSQRRVTRGGEKRLAWSVVADGVTRPVDGIANSRGSAKWSNERLTLSLHLPGHQERATAYVNARDALVVHGIVEHRGAKRDILAVFRRKP